MIRNATLAVTAENVDQVVAFARDAATGVGGYVFSSSNSYQGDEKHAQITLHVPFDQFDTVINRLRDAPGLHRVDTEATTSQDVTAEFVDAEARVRNLQATEQSLLALLDQAKQIDDILRVQTELGGVRGEIEALQGRLNYLSRLTDLSTITLTVAPSTATAKPDRFGNDSVADAAREAWNASLALVAGTANLLVRVIVFCWWLPPLALLVYAIARTRRGRHSPASPTPVTE